MMNIFVINLTTATERLAFQERQMRALGVTFHRIEAVTCANASGMRPNPYWTTWERPLRDSEKACFLSHHALWEKIAAGNTPALILEDDAVLSYRVPALLDRLSTVHGIDLLTLETRGRKKIVARARHPDGLPIRRLYQDRSGAAAYILWPEGARTLLRRTERRAGLADAVICAAYDLKTYQADPALALQIDRCEYFGLPIPVQTHSSITASEAPVAESSSEKPGLAFRLRRIAAQIRMGLRQVATLGIGRRRQIAPDPNDFRAVAMSDRNGSLPGPGS